MSVCVVPLSQSSSRDLLYVKCLCVLSRYLSPVVEIWFMLTVCVCPVVEICYMLTVCVCPVVEICYMLTVCVCPVVEIWINLLVMLTMFVVCPVVDDLKLYWGS